MTRTEVRRPALPAFAWYPRPSAWFIPPSPTSLPRSAVTLFHCAEETKWRRRRRGPGARASVPSSRPLVWPRWGCAHTEPPAAASPGPRFCLWQRPTCARAGSTHPPRSWSIPARAAVATPPPHPLLFVPLHLRVPGGSQVPEAGNVAAFVLTWRVEADPLPGTPFLHGLQRRHFWVHGVPKFLVSQDSGLGSEFAGDLRFSFL